MYHRDVSNTSSTTAAAMAAAVTENDKEDAKANGTSTTIEATTSNNTTTTSSNIVQDIPTSASYGTLQFREDPRAGMVNANGEQLVKSVTQIFQPIERCRRVLEKIWEDPYSVSFQDEVDTKLYSDYLEYVEEPMCLKDIKKKLESGIYNSNNYYINSSN